MNTTLKIVCGINLFFQTALCAMDVQNGGNGGRKLSYAVAQSLGGSRAQEDTYAVSNNLVAVFDGHGGKDVSEYAAQNIVGFFEQARLAGRDVPQAIEFALGQIEEKKRDIAVGSTAIVAAFDQAQVHIGDMGDSPCVIFDNTGDGYKLRFRTEGHTPARRDQAEQVFQAHERLRADGDGAWIAWRPKGQRGEKEIAGSLGELPADINSGKYTIYAEQRVQFLINSIMVTKALGDGPFKETGLVSGKPELLAPQKFDGNTLVMLASDGVTDSFNYDEITQQVNALMALSDEECARQCESVSSEFEVGNNARLSQVARLLTHRVVEKKKRDNVTIVLAQLAENQEEKQ